MKKYLSILFPIVIFKILFKNLKTIGKIIMVAALPLFVLTCVVDIILLFGSIVLWKQPAHWYFPFTGDAHLLMLDRALLLLGVVISIAVNYKKI
jgi:hypothetical protein